MGLFQTLILPSSCALHFCTLNQSSQLLSLSITSWNSLALQYQIASPEACEKKQTSWQILILPVNIYSHLVIINCTIGSQSHSLSITSCGDIHRTVSHCIPQVLSVLSLVGPRPLFSAGCRKGWEGVFWLLPLHSIAFPFPVLNWGVKSCRNSFQLFWGYSTHTI